MSPPSKKESLFLIGKKGSGCVPRKKFKRREPWIFCDFSTKAVEGLGKLEGENGKALL
jgi:hypothetical protein